MFVYSCLVLRSLLKSSRVLSSLYIAIVLQCCLMFFIHDFSIFLGRFWDQVLKGASGLFFFYYFPTWRPWATLGCSQDASRPSQDALWTRPRRPRDPSRRPKTVPRRALDEVKTPKKPAKTPFDAPRKPFDRAKRTLDGPKMVTRRGQQDLERPQDAPKTF